jgi:hypothetical protein
MVYGSWFIVHSKDVQKLFEKTKPICVLVNRRKVLFERGLCKYISRWGIKKQSQFIRSAFCVLRIV